MSRRSKNAWTVLDGFFILTGFRENTKKKAKADVKSKEKNKKLLEIKFRVMIFFFLDVNVYEVLPIPSV